MAEDDEDQNENVNAEDAEGEGAEGAEGEDSGSGKKKLLLFIVLPLLLLIGAGAGLYFTGMLDGLLGKTAEEHAEEGGEHGDDHGGGKSDSHGGKAKKDDHGDGHGGGHGESAFLEIPTIIVNLNSDDGTPRYLRLTVQLELQDPADSSAIEAIMPRVIDQFQTYLRELRVKDLRGSAGIYRLQMELLWRVNQAAAPVEVKDVLFQEILIQ